MNLFSLAKNSLVDWLNELCEMFMGVSVSQLVLYKNLLGIEFLDWEGTSP